METACIKCNKQNDMIYAQADELYLTLFVICEHVLDGRMCLDGRNYFWGMLAFIESESALPLQSADLKLL